MTCRKECEIVNPKQFMAGIDFLLQEAHNGADSEYTREAVRKIIELAKDNYEWPTPNASAQYRMAKVIIRSMTEVQGLSEEQREIVEKFIRFKGFQTRQLKLFLITTPEDDHLYVLAENLEQAHSTFFDGHPDEMYRGSEYSFEELEAINAQSA